MTRNQKIALGCGGAGCLGLIVVAVACVVLYLVYQKRPTFYTNRNSSYNINTNTNRRSSNNSAADSSEESSSSSLSEDGKHKLFQAASVTQDAELNQRVQKKIGLLNADGAPADEYAQFVKDHVVWLFKNTDFLKAVNTPEKARAYVEEHIDD